MNQLNSTQINKKSIVIMQQTLRYIYFFPSSFYLPLLLHFMFFFTAVEAVEDRFAIFSNMSINMSLSVQEV
jgi:hypothetical protein